MILLQDLKSISKARLKDANALFSKKRYQCAIYVSGYAVELALKWKICDFYGFPSFPENKSELTSCKKIQLSGDTSTALSLLTIKSIRNHELQRLLYLSGREVNIKRNFLDEWTLISQRNPENRYKVTYFKAKNVQKTLKATIKIVNNIML